MKSFFGLSGPGRAGNADSVVDTRTGRVCMAVLIPINVFFAIFPYGSFFVVCRTPPWYFSFLGRALCTGLVAEVVAVPTGVYVVTATFTHPG